jgi:hypothetical protein
MLTLKSQNFPGVAQTTRHTLFVSIRADENIKTYTGFIEKKKKIKLTNIGQDC